jgi:hypothetical protein
MASVFNFETRPPRSQSIHAYIGSEHGVFAFLLLSLNLPPLLTSEIHPQVPPGQKTPDMFGKAHDLGTFPLIQLAEFPGT